MSLYTAFYRDGKKSTRQNTDFWPKSWLLGDTFFKMQISRGFFDLSDNYKKTLACWNFQLFSKNNIILKKFYKNTEIFTLDWRGTGFRIPDAGSWESHVPRTKYIKLHFSLIYMSVWRNWWSVLESASKMDQRHRNSLVNCYVTYLLWEILKKQYFLYLTREKLSRVNV